MKKAWNTFNKYTAHGQRIGAMHRPDRSVIFSDVDRNVQGVIPSDVAKTYISPKSVVEWAYLRGEYDYGRGHVTEEEREELNALAETAPSLDASEVIHQVISDLCEMRRIGAYVPASAIHYVEQNKEEIREWSANGMSVREMSDLVIDLTS
jgi:hypothetical protein